MGYLVETNVLSELRKQQRCDPHVTGWLANVSPDELFVSVLSLGKIRRGIELLRKRPRPAPSTDGSPGSKRTMCEHRREIHTISPI